MKIITLMVDYHWETNRDYVTAHEGDIFSARSKRDYSNWTLRRGETVIHVVSINRSVSVLEAKALAANFVEHPEKWIEVNLND